MIIKKIFAFIFAIAVLLTTASCNDPDKKLLGLGTELFVDETTGDITVLSAATVTDREGRVQNIRLSLLKIDALEKGEVSAFDKVDDAVTDAFLKKNAEEIEKGVEATENPFKGAVLKAVADKRAKDFNENDFSLGLSLSGRFKKSEQIKENKIKDSYSVSICAATVKDERLCVATIDAAEPSIIRETNGRFIGKEYKNTKGEQGYDYGMVAYGGALREWYEQVDSICFFSEELSYNQIADIPAKNTRAKDPDLRAFCTISVTGEVESLLSAFADANKN